MNKLKIKVRLFDGQKLPEIIKKGDWVDLAASEEVVMCAPQSGILKKESFNGQTVSHRDVSFEMEYIPLGVAMQLPAGFEAIVVPRSSTAGKHGIIQANSVGVIDHTYCGDGDEWKFPAIALRDTTIEKGTRICQFRIQLSQKATFWQKLRWMFSSGIKLVEVDRLHSKNRNGIGSTGEK